MQLKEKAFFDFIHCPLFYHVSHELGLVVNKPNPLRDAVKQCISYFYTNLLNGQVKTYKEIQRKWDSLVIGFESKDIIKGWSEVFKVVEWSAQNKIVIGDTNCEYKYVFKDVIVTGSIDCIKVFDGKKIELFYLDFSHKKMPVLEYQYKLKYALDYCGFMQVYNAKPDRIHIYNIKNDESIFLTLSQQDIDRLNTSLYHVAKSIEYKLYYPREGFACDSCGGKGYCRYCSTVSPLSKGR